MKRKKRQKNLTDKWLKSFKNDEGKELIYTDTGSQGLQVRVSIDSKKTFRFRKTYKGNSYNQTIGDYPLIGLKDARAQVNKLTQGLENNRPLLNNIYFEQLAQEYLEDRLRYLKKSTKKEYKRIVETILLPRWGKYKCREITKYEIVTFIKEKFGRDVTRSKKICVQVMSNILKLGVATGQLSDNPAENINLGFKSESRDRVYTEAEIRKIWDVIMGFSIPHRLYFLTLFLYGQRKTETLQIKWNDIHLKEENPFWLIPKENAKNKTAHVLPMTPLFLKVIGIMKRIDTGSEYLFQSTRYANRGIGVKDKVKKIKNESGVSDFRIHDIRRTFATSVASFVDPHIISALLNHANNGMGVTAVYNRYEYFNDKKKALEEWEKKFSKIVDLDEYELFRLDI